MGKAKDMDLKNASESLSQPMGTKVVDEVCAANPFQPFLDKFFPDGVFNAEEMKSLCANLIEMKLQYQRQIDPPIAKESLYANAAANDEITVESWKHQWLWQAKENEELFKCSENTVMSEYQKYKGKPGIVAGSGPSLKKNAKELANRKDIPLVSCAHNFAFFVDNNIKPEYYVNLDAGHIIVNELSQGGKMPDEYYWEATKDCTLVAATVINPLFVKKWKGKVLWYNTAMPDGDLFEKMKKASPVDIYFNTGGNALGACYYFLRAILGCSTQAFVGADFSFAYNQKFHPFDSPYDQKFQGVVPCVDVYGNRVATWPSYRNFANWFEFQSMGGKGNNPSSMVNCTEGGILGATPDGNINTIKQMTLRMFLHLHNMSDIVPEILEKQDQHPQLLF